MPYLRAGGKLAGRAESRCMRNAKESESQGEIHQIPSESAKGDTRHSDAHRLAFHTNSRFKISAIRNNYARPGNLRIRIGNAPMTPLKVKIREFSENCSFEKQHIDQMIDQTPPGVMKSIA